MFKGFYNLTSGMLSQGRRLDVVANNMTNTSTTGYRADRYTDTTFREAVMSRVGNHDKRGAEEIGGESYILAPSQVYTDFSFGTPEPTGQVFDFAINGDGFFAIQTEDGVAYTRAGNFALDEEGYLSLPGAGRVLDMTGAEILLQTDRIRADGGGNIYSEEGAYYGQIGVYTFEDNGQLTRTPDGFFTGGQPQAANVPVIWKTQERSNVNLIEQMVQMLSSQRAYQSAAQMSKMYDQVMSKITTEIGRL